MRCSALRCPRPDRRLAAAVRGAVNGGRWLHRLVGVPAGSCRGGCRRPSRGAPRRASSRGCGRRGWRCSCRCRRPVWCGVRRRRPGRPVRPGMWWRDARPSRTASRRVISGFRSGSPVPARSRAMIRSDVQSVRVSPGCGCHSRAKIHRSSALVGTKRPSAPGVVTALIADGLPSQSAGQVGVEGHGDVTCRAIPGRPRRCRPLPVLCCGGRRRRSHRWRGSGVVGRWSGRGCRPATPNGPVRRAVSSVPKRTVPPWSMRWSQSTGSRWSCGHAGWRDRADRQSLAIGRIAERDGGLRRFAQRRRDGEQRLYRHGPGPDLLVDAPSAEQLHGAGADPGGLRER